jgi:hypothetical protein
MKLKRILGVFILTFLVLTFSISPIKVSAKSSCSQLTNSYFKQKYNATMSQSGGYYEIKVNPSSDDSDTLKKLRKVDFIIYKINDVEQTGNLIVNYKSSQYLAPDFVTDDEGDKSMTVVLRSEQEDVDNKCSGYIEITLNVSRQGDVINTYDQVSEFTLDEEISTFTDKTIDCNNPDGSIFQTEFCKAKKGATGTSFDYTNKFNEGAKFSGLAELKCAVDKFATSDNYYVNTTYMYGSGVRTIKAKSNYQYHYKTGLSATQGERAQCKVKCEEAVAVEYGPPVASKAGLCFEYKVKVTSRVTCSITEKPKKAKVSTKVCTPTPWCTNKKQTYTVNQGGPSEDFDNCVQSCDGGKYTDKCTNKCYKKVYGTSSTSVKKTSNLAIYYVVDKVASFSVDECIQNNPKGCYAYVNGTLTWVSGNQSYGRWYSQAEGNKCYQGKCSGVYDVDSMGIFRRNKGDTDGDGEDEHCTDNCWWDDSSCDSDAYLNPNIAQLDKDENQEIYDDLVAECKAAASCTTTTATFTIKVDYSTNDSNGNAVSQTPLVFPYTSNNDQNSKDKLTSKGNGASVQDTISNSNTTILSYAGCYKNSDNNNWYQSEWSFPGSWINNKTGELSYIDKTGTGWQTMKDKFCIPLNASNVNQKWWNYYYNKLGLTNTAIYSNSFTSECESNGKSCNGSDSIKNKTTTSESDVDSWNITASTEKFGYYSWNIQISCFYALNTDPCLFKKTKSDCDNTKCCTNDTPEADYTIRSVDLTDLFPSTQGTSISSSSSTGRSPGFNWTSFADNTKNSSFTSKPSEYATTVQTLGYSVYDDSYLDYEFNISSSTLKQVKNLNKNYTAFSGTSSISNGVTAYKSNLFRGDGVLASSAVHIPSTSVLGCNNIKNYSSLTCEN